MLDSDLRELLLETARHLIDASDDARAGGAEIAREIGLSPEDIAVHDAFREIEDRRELKLSDWDDGRAGLPRLVQLPDA